MKYIKKLNIDFNNWDEIQNTVKIGDKIKLVTFPYESDDFDSIGMLKSIPIGTEFFVTNVKKYNDEIFIKIIDYNGNNHWFWYKLKYFKIIKKVNEGMDTPSMNEYPYQYNTIDNMPSDNSIGKQLLDNKFQQIQDALKLVIKKNNPNFDDSDIEKQLQGFFKIGSYKLSDIKTISDNCTNIQKCANKIYKKYFKYVDIDQYKDNVNDVNTDVVMENKIKRFLKF